METKWLQVDHFGFCICSFVMLYPCVTPDILFLMTDLAIMQYFSEIISKSDQN